MAFPIHRIDEREFDPKWQGEVFVCDIDRTYLATRFSSMKGMARIPFEFAIDKQEIEGMVPLLKEVRRGPESQSRSTPLYFISASPAQLRPVIQRKMLLDGLEFDGTTFKNWVKVMMALRPRRLREQLGFKVTALLSGRLALPQGAQEVLVGDDLEADALAFALYADLLAGTLDPHVVLQVLSEHGVAADDARSILDLAQRLPGGLRVKRALIRMERHRDAEPFRMFFPHLVACLGAFQMALCLWDQGSISLDGVARVGRDMIRAGGQPEPLGGRLRDACKRALLLPERAEQAADRLSADGVVPRALHLPEPDERWNRARHEPPERWTPDFFLQPAP